DEDSSLPALAEGVRKRQNRVPLQYILGETTFFTETYKVTEDCLIPRSDTEVLVETAVGIIPPDTQVADFCTGSGCVAVSLLAHRRDLRATAYDFSGKALTLAEYNARQNGVFRRMTFEKRDLLSDPPDCTAFSAVVSNPPYIPTKDIAGLSPEVKSEPFMALDGGEDGLCFYRAFLRLPVPLFLFEIGFNQGDAIKRLGEEHGYTVTVRKDYGGNDRVAILQRKSSE
ncbi:MAG: peptide chain release factor N(5)-glutamine methyltransferase, partial [Clostridia bacterium]|nr:peptide chain release factor N(5)-glutamine methyltransferase [Clostridia bacterium]